MGESARAFRRRLSRRKGRRGTVETCGGRISHGGARHDPPCRRHHQGAALLRQLLRYLPWRGWRPDRRPGFVEAGRGAATGSRDLAHAHRAPPRVQYGQDELFAYFAYARQYTLCDRYFSEVAGPAAPNQLMLLAAASPVLEGAPLTPGHPTYDLPSLPASLERTGLPWHVYRGHACTYLTGL